MSHDRPQSPVPGPQSLPVGPQTTVLGFPVGTGRNGAYISRRAQGIQALSLWKSEQHAQPDNWLRQEIAVAFQQLVCLALEGQPAAEMLPFTAEMWATTISLGLNEAQDRARIRTGFGVLFRKLKKWPQPTELLAELPPRPKAGSDARTMAAPISDEQHARNGAALEEILDKLNREA